MTPQWYVDLIELKPIISNKDWQSVYHQAFEINKQLFAESSAIKAPIETIISLTKDSVLSDEQETQLLSSYNEALIAAENDLKTDDFTRIMKEENLFERLNELFDNSNRSLQIIWNYWRGTHSGEYQEWLTIKKEISEYSLTKEGRIRLLARHATVGKRILPTFTKMVVQLWPLAAFWVIKKVVTTLITTSITQAMEARKTRKQLQEFKKRLQMKDISVPSLKSKPKPKRK